MYTFDPNDEDDWDSELLCQDQNFVVQKTQVKEICKILSKPVSFHTIK